VNGQKLIDDTLGGGIRGRFKIFYEPAWLGLVVIFLILTLPLVLSSHGGYDFDELNFHLPAIRAIGQKWPALSLQDNALSATAPGYHWFLAGLSLVFGGDVLTVRIENLIVSLVGLAILYGWLRRRFSANDAVLIIGPLAASNFYIKSASWVVTDNPALILVTVSLMAALNPKPGYSGAIIAGATGGLATFTRQLHAWIVAPILFNVLIFSGPKNPLHPTLRREFIGWAVAALIPLTVLAFLYFAWGGFVPKRWQEVHYGLSTVSLAYLLSVMALFGGFAYPYHQRARGLKATSLIWLIALIVGGGTAILMPTTYDYAGGHWGGYIWELARRLPAPFDRSIVFIGLAPLGAFFIICFFLNIYRAGQYHCAITWLIAFCAWSATAAVNRQIFQRYFEPMGIVFMIFAIGLSSMNGLGATQRKLLAILSFIQIVITLTTAWYSTLAS
jgi:Dolichyl-phosphate-mannose-protein mannosyltransferase